MDLGKIVEIIIVFVMEYWIFIISSLVFLIIVGIISLITTNKKNNDVLRELLEADRLAAKQKSADEKKAKKAAKTEDYQRIQNLMQNEGEVSLKNEKVVEPEIDIEALKVVKPREVELSKNVEPKVLEHEFRTTFEREQEEDALFTYDAISTMYDEEDMVDDEKEDLIDLATLVRFDFDLDKINKALEDEKIDDTQIVETKPRQVDVRNLEVEKPTVKQDIKVEVNQPVAIPEVYKSSRQSYVNQPEVKPVINVNARHADVRTAIEPEVKHMSVPERHTDIRTTVEPAVKQEAVTERHTDVRAMIEPLIKHETVTERHTDIRTTVEPEVKQVVPERHIEARPTLKPVAKNRPATEPFDLKVDEKTEKLSRVEQKTYVEPEKAKVAKEIEDTHYDLYIQKLKRFRSSL